MNVEEVFFSIARDIKRRLAETDSRDEVRKCAPFLVFLFLSDFLCDPLFLFLKSGRAVPSNMGILVSFS